MKQIEKEVEQLKAEVEYYKKIVSWYRDTYETRSTQGVIKEKLKRGLQKRTKTKRFKADNSPKSIAKWTNGNSFEIKSSETLSLDKTSFYANHLTDEKLLKIGIFVQLFYQDLWEEINNYLKNIGVNFDLLVSLNEEDVNCESTIAVIKKDYPNAFIIKVPNKGLDVGPFFELVNFAIEKQLEFDYILKIHTKKSLGVNAEVGEWWRRKSYESLMGSHSIVHHILRLFSSNPKLGMIGPYETRTSITMSDLENGGNANADNLNLLTDKLQIKDQNLDFFGGTMFWVKWSIFADKFRYTTLTINDFESGYKKDALLSHAMERLFASIVRDAGFYIYEMSKINDYIFYKNKKKKVCWVHPGYGIGGGNRIILDICQEQMKYYEVYSVSYMGQPFSNWMDISHSALSFSNPDEAKHFIETVGIDYVFATGWQTVDFIKQLNSVQKKFYFIQDYEPWFADANEHIAKSTYENTFNANIVYSDWLKHKLRIEHGLDPVFVKCGVNNYLIEPSVNNVIKNNRILLYYKLKNHYGRGADLIEQLLEKLSKHKEIELNVIGHEDPKIEGINFLGELHKDALVDLYSNSDVFVDLSRHRGVATISLEVAQFGVVSLLSHKEFGLIEYGFEDGVNCLFVENVDDAYHKVIRLSKSLEEFKRLRIGALELSKTFKYKYTVNDFNQVLDVIT